jgi:hypothetical protein
VRQDGRRCPATAAISTTRSRCRWTIGSHSPVAIQIRRFEFKTGETVDVTAGESSGAAAVASRAAARPRPRSRPTVAGSRSRARSPTARSEFKGHKYGPRTALWLRDMKTGSERLLMDPIEPLVPGGSKTLGVLPRYRWASDGKTILIMQGGKLRRLDVDDA